MNKTSVPKSMRLHIGIFGRRNAGKSSLMNIVTHQDTSIVSEIAGTTTDSVEKSMEMLPLGPVVFIDTAGIDDVGIIGEKRIEKAEKVTERTDVAIIICDYNGWTDYEIKLANNFKNHKVPILSVINKIDLKNPNKKIIKAIEKNSDYVLCVSLKNDKQISEKIREALIKIIPDNLIHQPSVLDGLVNEEDTVILVTPIDKEAPKGRLILPQVNVLRELLDNHCITVVVTEKQLSKALKQLKNPPKIVITDSQAFKEVSAIVPENIPLTSFSILFARLKGDLKIFYEGIKTIETLKNNDKILICESCTHHPIEDDIGRVKIPKLIKEKTGKNLIFENVSSHEFPTNINDYKLIVHCGGCMTNRSEILSRINKAKEKNTPITNYGITISYCLGICDRAMQPFNQL